MSYQRHNAGDYFDSNIEVDISSGIVNGNIKFGVTNGIPMGFDCLVGNDIAKSNRSNPFDDIFVVTRAKTRALVTPTFNSYSKTDLSTDVTDSVNSKPNVQLVTDKVTDHLTNKVDTVID